MYATCKSRVQRINLVMTRFSLAADASQSTNHIYVITNSRNQIEAYVCDNKFRIQIQAYRYVLFKNSNTSSVNVKSGTQERVDWKES